MQQNLRYFFKNSYFCPENHENGGKMKQFALVLALFSVAFVLKVKAQTDRMVLIESFTNAGCVPCAQQNPAFDTLLGANSARVAVVKYHSSWPMANDPMYLADAEAIDTRTDFYHVVNVPTAIIDGNRYYAAPSSVTQSVIDQLLAIPSRFELQLYIEADTLNNRLLAKVEGRPTTLVAGDLRLFVALVENELHFETAPGPNGEKDFYHVLHQFLTESTGLGLGSMDSGQQFAYEFDYDLPQNQSFNNLSVVVWVQNYNTKEVYQACKGDAMATTLDETAQENLWVYPNPTKDMVNIVSYGQKVAIYNMVGQCVFESGGETVHRIDMKPYGSGIYVVKTGNQTQKIIVN